MSIWGKILYKGSSKINGELVVVDSLGKRRLIASGFIQSRDVKGPGTAEFYWSGFVDGLNRLPQGAKVLILGFAAGTIGLILRRRFPTIEIDGVEIDPTMIELGREYFDLEQVKANIFLQDAQDYVQNCEEKYDLICVDVFLGDRSPNFVFSGPFAQNLKKLMKKESIIIFNKIYDSLEDAQKTQDNFANSFKFLQEFHSPAWTVPGNLVLYGALK